MQDSPIYQLLPLESASPEYAATTFRSEASQAEHVKDELDPLLVPGEDSGPVPTVREARLSLRPKLMRDSTPETALFVKLMMAHRWIRDWSGMLEVSR